MVRKRTLVNAVIGAVVSLLLSFIPFSTVLGGLVSGFLEGSDAGDGAVVGALAGTIAFLPLAAFAFAILAFVGVGVIANAIPLGGLLAGIVVVAFVTTMIFAYTVGLALVGGVLGAMAAGEFPQHSRTARETVGVGADAETDYRTTYGADYRPDRRRDSETGRRSDEADRRRMGDPGGSSEIRETETESNEPSDDR